MGHARCRCVALEGVTGHVVDVEAHLGGIPGFSIGGLPDSTVMQARDRVRAAMLCAGLPWPAQRITVNLSPASLPKTGTHYDLALAVVIAAANDAVPVAAAARTVFLAELSLDGRLRPVPGVLPAVAAAARAGLRRVVVARENVAEAELVGRVDVVGARTVGQVIAAMRGDPVPDDPAPDAPAGDEPTEPADRRATPVPPAPDLADVVGQHLPRRALEVATAGGHHLLMVGPPGAGKTMLASRAVGLLPDLDLDDALEVTALHSVAGLLPAGAPLLRRPPFADPHHTASMVALVGGGSPVRPGAISMAHRGLLFMDEAPEFPPAVLDALRQPLEHGSLLVSRARTTVRFPSRFLLVLAANPCPCGYHGVAGRSCVCPPERVRRYRLRLSGPVRDRIDLHVPVAPVHARDLGPDASAGEPTRVVAERVAEARQRQAHRLRGTAWKLNGDVPGAQIRHVMPVPADAADPATTALCQGRLTARGAARALRVAWTMADLAGRGKPGRDDVELAIMAHAAGAP